MPAKRSSPLPLAAAALVAIFAGPACVGLVGAAHYVDREEKRFPVSGRPDVVLSTFDGSIEIRAWDRAEVLVVVEKRGWDKAAAAAIEVHAEQNGNRIAVDAREPKGIRAFGFAWGWGGSRSAKLVVSVPVSSDVTAKSGDGSIDAERVSGKLDLRSGDGNVSGHDLAGDLKVHTGDGSIRLETVSGGLDAETGDGGITVNGKMTSVRVHTGDGSVTLRAAPGSATAGDWDITTGDGSVTLELPAGFGGELDAHTGDGGIRMQDVTVNVSGQVTRDTVRGRLGEGGRALRVRTGDGSITLRRF